MLLILQTTRRHIPEESAAYCNELWDSIKGWRILEYSSHHQCISKDCAAGRRQRRRGSSITRTSGMSHDVFQSDTRSHFRGPIVKSGILIFPCHDLSFPGLCVFRHDVLTSPVKVAEFHAASCRFQALWNSYTSSETSPNVRHTSSRQRDLRYGDFASHRKFQTESNDLLGRRAVFAAHFLLRLLVGPEEGGSTLI